MNKIVNLTQHNPTTQQLAAGVFDYDQESVKALLNFGGIPSKDNINAKAAALAEVALASGATSAMVGGAPYLMAPLVMALRRRGIAPLFSFTQRESMETPDGKGGVVKTSVFNHVGFVEV